MMVLEVLTPPPSLSLSIWLLCYDVVGRERGGREKEGSHTLITYYRYLPIRDKYNLLCCMLNISINNMRSYSRRERV